MKRILMLLGIVLSIQAVFSQNIIKAEYFLDADPGQGNGIAVPNFSPADIVNFSFSISTSTLTNGFHTLNTRVAADDGKWSRYETRTFYISSPPTANTTNIAGAEYFIDSDTVPGSGIPINIGVPGPLVNFTVLIPAGLSSGFHSLGIRVKDEEGKWSLFEERSFYVMPDPVDAPPIVAAEYFYDVDPGIGNASPLVVSPTGNIITQTFLVPVPTGLSQGDHVLAIRVRDQQGHWSFLAKDTITVSNSASISCPSNKLVAAPAGQCNAVVNGIDPVIAPAGTSYTYTLTGATNGNGTGSASGKIFNVGVTTVTYALTNSPGTNCSFTVTVNSTTVPSVTIAVSTASPCPVQPITFTATPINGGANPTYQWKKNGVNIGDGSNIFQSNGWTTGDVVTVIMTSSIACANPASDTSNAITITLTPPYLNPSVNITSSSTTICPGQPVTFTATSSNGGVPHYAWMVNEVFIEGDFYDSIFQSSTLVHGDKVKCVMTSSLACVTNVTSISNEIQVSVVSEVTPEVNIAASATTICSGTQVTFTAIPTNGGTNPVYQWKLNGNNIPNATGSTYQSSTLINGDVIEVEMTSSLACTNSATVISNGVTITVTSAATPSVSISTPLTTICQGSTVTFTASPVNGGAAPTYQWKVNNINVGDGSATYITSTLTNGDVVKVVMTSTLACTGASTVTSNNISIAVTPPVAAVVNMQVSATTICAGTTVTFTATPINGGANPVYQWKLNGNNIAGATNSTYQTSSLQNGDKVKVVMTSSALCASPSSAASEEVTMTVNSSAVPSVTIEANAASICTGQLVTFTAIPDNGGNNPVYEWTLNNNAVGTNSPIFQSSTLVNGDKVRVTMAPSQGCGNNTPVFSNTITVTVGAVITPSVTMSAVNSTACAGTLAIFYATPISGAGSSPSYQWKRNGVNIPGATNSTYQSSSLQNGDVIRVAMTSSLSCADPQTVLSHDSVTMIISSIPLTPSVTISATATAICQGQTVLFTAVPTNGGDLPGYQWKLNGINVGDNIDTYSTSSLQHGDKVTVEMTTSVPCSTSPTVVSAPVTMTVTSVSIFYADLDGDGYGNGASGVAEACTAPPGYVSNSSDCNDDNASVHPDVTEICGNSIDDDCDGQVDETCGSPDNDGDGYTLAQGDCNDNNAAINPGAAEICDNGIDDNCNGSIDENCTVELPVLLVKTNPVKEGDTGYTTLSVEIKLDRVAVSPVSVNFTTSNANATAGLDYVAANGVLTIPAGAVSGSIQVRIIGDIVSENNESFWINFSNPVNVLFGSDPRARIMIIDDDNGKPNSASLNKETITEVSPFKIPTVVKRNTVWMIPQISNYENEVLILNVQGQVVNRFINYKNQTSVGNVAAGLYFYRIRITEHGGQHKFYSGRLLITE